VGDITLVVPPLTCEKVIKIFSNPYKCKVAKDKFTVKLQSCIYKVVELGDNKGKLS
jgi:hypothetical protein